VDQLKRARLIQLLDQLGGVGSDSPLPVVSLEDYFNGNDDLGSIGCNLSEHPGVSGFFEVLSAVRNRPDVQDVLVEISDADERDPTTWPFSERVYIITTAAESDVAEWLTALKPSEVEVGWSGERPTTAPIEKPGYHAVAAWWD